MLPIGGFQKMSLIDFPETICSIVFTRGCVFRCSYCHNPDLIPFQGTTLDESDIFAYLSKNRNMIEGVCITGGEPTLHQDLIPFMEKIKEQNFKIKLDTNGIRPDVIKKILEKELVEYIAMDIKAPWEKYDAIIQSAIPNAAHKCEETFHMIQKSGINHEFRTTVFQGVHTRDDFFVMAGYCRDGEKYFLQEMRTEKTLDTTISEEKSFIVKELCLDLKNAFPNLVIDVR